MIFPIKNELYIRLIFDQIHDNLNIIVRIAIKYKLSFLYEFMNTCSNVS